VQRAMCFAFGVWRLAFCAETCDPYGLPYSYGMVTQANQAAISSYTA
jgi:hypothetical protein